MSAKIVIALLIFFAIAWTWEGHNLIVDSVYYSMNDDARLRLNLSAMRDGSVAPDAVFHDNRFHHYPPSYRLASDFLNKSGQAYDDNDYSNASYLFGVASHYISDSFAAPHNVEREDMKLHSLFEKQAVSALNVRCRKEGYDLETALRIAAENSRDWEEWLKRRNNEIPRRELEQSLELVMPAALDIFNASCSNRLTVVRSAPIVTGNLIANLSILAGIIASYYIIRS
jgi:hypothetical protein